MANTLLQNNDLIYVRGEAQVSLPDTVSIQRRTLTSDGQGGFAESWSISYPNISARLGKSGNSETINGSRQEAVVTLTVTLPYSQSVEESDRIIHSTGTFEVTGINDSQTWGTVRVCQVRKL